MRDGKEEDVSAESEDACKGRGAATARGLTCNTFNNHFGTMSKEQCPTYASYYGSKCCSDGGDGAPKVECLCPGSSVIKDAVLTYECYGSNGERLKEMRDGKEEDVSAESEDACKKMGADTARGLTCGFLNSHFGTTSKEMCSMYAFSLGSCCTGK